MLTRRGLKKVSECHLMHQTGDFAYYSNGEYQFLKFSFSDSAELYVLFALPITDTLITDKSVIDDALKKLESTYVALALPKLSIEASYTLNEPLMDLGITDAFTSNADFSAMAENQKLKIDQVIHKTMVKMDENGLVAAAVTIIDMMDGAIDEEELPIPILFKADHPFQMFIIDGDHDNAILFMGDVNKPGIPKGSDVPKYNESANPIWNNFTSLFDGMNQQMQEEEEEEQQEVEEKVEEEEEGEKEENKEAESEKHFANLSQSNVFSSIIVALISVVAAIAVWFIIAV